MMTKSTTIIVDGQYYNVLTKRVVAGFEGYVIKDGDFFCFLPLVDRERQLLAEAESRIKELTHVHLRNQ